MLMPEQIHTLHQTSYLNILSELVDVGIIEATMLLVHVSIRGLRIRKGLPTPPAEMATAFADHVIAPINLLNGGGAFWARLGIERFPLVECGVSTSSGFGS